MLAQNLDQGAIGVKNLFALLVSKLMKEGRSEDVERAATDEAYRKTLYAEYNLK